MDALGPDTEPAEKLQRSVEKGDGALGGFIREEPGEGDAGMVVDGDVEELPARARRRTPFLSRWKSRWLLELHG